MKRIAKKRKQYVNCLVERVDEELSCGSLFQFKIDPVVYVDILHPTGISFLAHNF